MWLGKCTMSSHFGIVSYNAGCIFLNAELSSLVMGSVVSVGIE